MPILEEPLPKPLAHVLRQVVLDFRRSHPHRVYPTTVHVGHPATRVATFTHAMPAGPGANPGFRATKLKPPPPLDLAQQADLLGVMVDDFVNHTPLLEPMVWITRTGEVGYPHDVDLRWLAAASLALTEWRMPLTMFVVTRQGWYDPRSGVTRRWRRLRER